MRCARAVGAGIMGTTWQDNGSESSGSEDNGNNEDNGSDSDGAMRGNGLMKER